mgnify:FL=1
MLISYAALAQVSLVADAVVHSFDVGGVADQSSAALDTSCHVSGVFSRGVHISGVFCSTSHFSIARHVVDNAVAIDDAENCTLLTVAVVLSAVLICDALLNTTTAFDDVLEDGVIFDIACLTRTISELVVDVVVIALLELRVLTPTADVDALADIADATSRTRWAEPDVVDDVVLLADASRTLCACVAVVDTVIMSDALNLTRTEADAVDATVIIVPAPSVTKPSSPKLYEPYVLRPYPLRYSAISLA